MLGCDSCSRTIDETFFFSQVGMALKLSVLELQVNLACADYRFQMCDHPQPSLKYERMLPPESCGCHVKSQTYLFGISMYNSTVVNVELNKYFEV